MEEINVSKETLKLNLGGGPGHGGDGVNFLWQRHNARRVDNMAKVLDLGRREDTFLAVDAQASRVKAPKDLVEIL